MLIESFLRYIQYEKVYSPHTVLSYKNDLFSFREYVEGETGEFVVAEITPALVRGFVVKLLDEGCAPRTVARKVSALRALFRYLVKQGEVETNPAMQLHLPKTKKSLPSFVKPKEMDVLLDEVDFGDGFVACRNKLIIELLYATGMRRSELIALADEDVSLETQLIKVHGKRGKERLIPIGNELTEHLQAYIALRNEEVKGVEAFFVKEDGAPLYPTLLYRLVTRQLGEVTTLQRKSPHVLRHTFASAMLNNGARLNSIKELLGHSSLASTEVYTHITFAELKQSYKQAHPRADKKGGRYGS